MGAVGVLLFCQCGTDRVDSKLWFALRPQIRCLTCGNEAWLDGFTISEFDIPKFLAGSLIDQARNSGSGRPTRCRREAAAKYFLIFHLIFGFDSPTLSS
jgi:hypothetical protein